MKIKRLVAALLCLALLTGCQLAQEDAGNSGGDRLVGVLVTREYLDLFDFEGYLNDNLSGFSGGELAIDGDATPYEGRLYATLKNQTLTSEETGEQTVIQDYVFEGVEGISLLAATIPATETQDSFISSISDDAISDGHLALSYGDDEDKMTLEGTIYLAAGEMLQGCYFNPVYQSADGSVYAMSGSGISVESVDGVGGTSTQTLEESTTVTENGKSKTVSCSVKISVTEQRVPERIVLLEMDAESRVLTRQEYLPGSLPDTFTPTSETAYLVVETHTRGADNAETVTRELFDTTAESLTAFFCREDGICIKGSTALDWKTE